MCGTSASAAFANVKVEFILLFCGTFNSRPAPELPPLRGAINGLSEPQTDSLAGSKRFIRGSGAALLNRAQRVPQGVPSRPEIAAPIKGVCYYGELSPALLQASSSIVGCYADLWSLSLPYKYGLSR